MEDNQKNIKYPYLPEGRTILYVPISNPYMAEAKDFAFYNSKDRTVPDGVVIVKSGKIIGQGANGSTYHDTHRCERIRRNIPTGQGYELCEGCHPKNHGEPKAVENAKRAGYKTNGADLYLWGHWWFCELCWNTMIEAGIRNAYLLEDSEILFNENSDKNIIGHQFDR